MKRFFLFPMILFLVLVLSPIANARSLPIPSETVLTVLDRQVSETVKARLCDREMYDETGITELSPEGMPILRIYYGNLAFYSELPLEQALTTMTAESDAAETYLLFGEDTVYCATPVSVRNTEKLRISNYIADTATNETYPFLRDILTLDTVFREKGGHGTIQNIYLTASAEINTVIVTDQGSFVLHYRGELAEGTLYPADTYRHHAKRYTAYLKGRTAFFGDKYGTIGLESFMEHDANGTIPAKLRIPMVLFLHPVVSIVAAIAVVALIVVSVSLLVRQYRKRRAS